MVISVIIPVYNKEEYLRGCLDSVCSQSYSDLQIILVDDCSTDGSKAICQEYCKSDSRINLLLHEKNQGQPASIVDALKLVKGEWVTFVDADDQLPQNSISTLVSFVSDQSDLVVGFSFDWDNRHFLMPIKEWRSSLIKSDAILCTRWAKLYRRNMVDEFTCSAPEGIKFGEDEIMNIKVAFKTDKPICITRQKVYDYNQNESSITMNYKWTVEKYERLFDAIEASIPEQERANYAQELATYGIEKIRHMILKCPFKEQRRIKNSAFHRKVSLQTEKSGILLPKTDYLMMNHPSSLFTCFIIRARRGFEIIFRVIRKKLFKR